MYKKSREYVLDQSVSSLHNNLDVLHEDDRTNDEESGGFQRLSFLTASKNHVNILHHYQDGKRSFVQVTSDSRVKKQKVLQAKWCHLLNQIILVITSYKGLVICDGEGQLLMFWHIPQSEDDTEIAFYRGIACVSQKYICVGSNNGKVLVIVPERNSFLIKETLHEHAAPLSALCGLQTKPHESEIDFVSADDSGVLCSFKSGHKFKFVSRFGVRGENFPCTSIQLLPNALLVAGFMNGHLRVFDVTTSTMLADISAHVRAVSCLDTTLTPESNSYTVISGSEDSFIRVWKISRQDTISVNQEWFTNVKDLQVCGARFCDPKGHSFVLTGYDIRQVMEFSRIY